MINEGADQTDAGRLICTHDVVTTKCTVDLLTGETIAAAILDEQRWQSP